MSTLSIRPAGDGDGDAIWDMLRPVIRAGETYALPRDLGQAEALAYWAAPGHAVVVAEAGGDILGTSYLRANQRGGGAHVANAAFVTAEAVRGRGVARALCGHALDHARSRGFRAMQFNFVVVSNEAAVRLWTALGFATVGRLPLAFDHPRLGSVDALVMHRAL